MIRRRHDHVEVSVHLDRATLDGTLLLPQDARGVVLFAHGSGSGHRSPRNIFVAERLFAHGLGALLTDLLTSEEDVDVDRRFDIPFLARRVKDVTAWLHATFAPGAFLPVGYYGASTGAAAALAAAADLGPRVRAVVSRGGRPDLVEDVLGRVRAPTLLLVGGADAPLLAWNRRAFERLAAPKALTIVPDAGHLFEEPGALERVADEAAAWFGRHLPGEAPGVAA
jgi:putative phosphoribosyl transferase